MKSLVVFLFLLITVHFVQSSYAQAPGNFHTPSFVSENFEGDPTNINKDVLYYMLSEGSYRLSVYELIRIRPEIEKIKAAAKEQYIINKADEYLASTARREQKLRDHPLTSYFEKVYAWNKSNEVVNSEFTLKMHIKLQSGDKIGFGTWHRFKNHCDAHEIDPSQFFLMEKVYRETLAPLMSGDVAADFQKLLNLSIDNFFQRNGGFSGNFQEYQIRHYRRQMIQKLISIHQEDSLMALREKVIKGSQFLITYSGGQGKILTPTERIEMMEQDMERSISENPFTIDQLNAYLDEIYSSHTKKHHWLLLLREARIKNPEQQITSKESSVYEITQRALYVALRSAEIIKQMKAGFFPANTMDHLWFVLKKSIAEKYNFSSDARPAYELEFETCTKKYVNLFRIVGDSMKEPTSIRPAPMQDLSPQPSNFEKVSDLTIQELRRALSPYTDGPTWRSSAPKDYIAMRIVVRKAVVDALFHATNSYELNDAEVLQLINDLGNGEGKLKPFFQELSLRPIQNQVLKIKPHEIVLDACRVTLNQVIELAGIKIRSFDVLETKKDYKTFVMNEHLRGEPLKVRISSVIGNMMRGV